jgi:flagellar assembly protein FliH
MNSLFEHISSPPMFPGGLVKELITRGSQSVSALNFVSVEPWEPIVEAGEQQAQPEPMPEPVDLRAQQIAVMVEAAREDAAEQTRVRMQSEMDVQQERERARAERLTVEFARDRRRYFAAAETQVVRLALAIASRVLAREVQTSELPLAEIVKAALAKVQDGSESVLRVHPDLASQWRVFFQHEARINVTEDGTLAPDDCVLETKIGRVDLSVATQMQEIERGFDDLIARTGD